LTGITEEDKAKLTDFCENKTVADLKSDIKHLSDQLSQIHEGNPNAIKNYEAREKDINALKAKMAGQQEILDGFRAQLEEIRGRWEPRIDKLIENISDAFSKSFEFISCAGAVRVKKEAHDFENWAIEILVKFR
jgi:structural maintenance of chromosomes protein 5